MTKNFSQSFCVRCQLLLNNAKNLRAVIIRNWCKIHLYCPPSLEFENSLKMRGKHSSESSSFPWKPSQNPNSTEVIKETFLPYHSPSLPLNAEQLKELQLLEHIPLLPRATPAWVRTLKVLGPPCPFTLSDSSQILCLHSWVLTAQDSWITAESLGCGCRRTCPSVCRHDKSKCSIKKTFSFNKAWKLHLLRHP